MLHAVAGKPSQDLLRFGCAKAERGGIFDHLVVLLPNEFPSDRSGENVLQVGICIGLPHFGTVELLGMEIFQARQQLEAQ